MFCLLCPTSFSLHCASFSYAGANLQRSNNTGIFDKPLTQQPQKQNIGLENYF